MKIYVLYPYIHKTWLCIRIHVYHTWFSPVKGHDVIVDLCPKYTSKTAPSIEWISSCIRVEKIGTNRQKALMEYLELVVGKVIWLVKYCLKLDYLCPYKRQISMLRLIASRGVRVHKNVAHLQRRYKGKTLYMGVAAM